MPATSALPAFNPGLIRSPEYFRNPYPVLRRLRDEHPRTLAVIPVYRAATME